MSQLDRNQEYLKVYEIPFDKFYRFSTVPGGFYLSIDILIGYMARIIWDPYIRETGDDPGVATDTWLEKIVHRQLMISDKEGTEWTASLVSSTIEDADIGPHVCWVYDEECVPVYKNAFPETQLLLSTWHSREVGEMLARKVAGHLLPPELVELIAGGLYDTKAECFKRAASG